MSGITGAGALYQIKNYNTNLKNNYLEINPQISFFKVVYRKYSRFAIENIEINEFTRNILNYDNNITINCDIPRNGDLLKNIYFTFELPHIYSGSYTNNNILYTSSFSRRVDYIFYKNIEKPNYYNTSYFKDSDHSMIFIDI